MYWQFANRYIFNGTQVSLAVPNVINVIIKGLVLYILVLIFNFVLKEIMRLNRWQTAFGVLLMTFPVILYFFQIIHNVYGYVNSGLITTFFLLTFAINIGIGVMLCIKKPALIFGKKNENEFRDYVNDRLAKLEGHLIAESKKVSEMNMSSRTSILNSMMMGQSEVGIMKDNTAALSKRLGGDAIENAKVEAQKLVDKGKDVSKDDVVHMLKSILGLTKEGTEIGRRSGRNLVEKIDKMPG